MILVKGINLDNSKLYYSNLYFVPYFCFIDLKIFFIVIVKIKHANNEVLRPLLSLNPNVLDPLISYNTCYNRSK